MTITVDVLAEKIDTIDEKVDQICREIHSHSKDMEQVKIDVAVFKARWGMLAVVGSAVVSVLISALFSMFNH